MSALQSQMPVFRIDRKRYYEMIDSGALGPDDKLELLDGQLVKKMTIGRRHALCIDRLNMHFAQLGGELATVRVQSPVQIDNHNEPEPDVALLRPESQRDLSDQPRPQDVFLIVEVADSSLLRDRNVKVPLYAKVGIPECWLVDLNTDAVFVHRDPAGDAYGSVQRHTGEDRLAPLAFPNHAITVAQLLR